MGFRFRKSFKIAPGVKLNVSKKSIGISAGTKGARVSVNSSGRVTKSVSVPGTGISYVKSEKLGSGKSPAQKAAIVEDAPDTSMSPTPAPEPVIPPAPPSNSGKQKKYRIIQILSILIIAMSLLMSIASAPTGLFFTGLGCFLLHHRATLIGKDTRPFYRRRWQIVVAVLYVFLAFSGATLPDPITEIVANTSTPSELSVNNSETIVFTYQPKDAATDEITCTPSDESIATVEVMSIENGEIACLVTPLAAGEVSISCASGNVSAPDVTMTVRDPAAEKAEQERIAAEKAEQERIAAEKAEQERIAAEKAEQERIAAEQAEQERIAAEQEQEAASAGQTVYITPSGKRYHLDPDCGGKNSRAVSIDDVGGRTPCQKCAS